MTAPGQLIRLAVYVDRTGKQPPAPETLRLESTDAVKTAKFFAALGFTVEKQTLPDGRQFVLGRATNVQLAIVPSHTPTPIEDFSMTLIVEDAGAAAARAETFGGMVLSPLKEIPGGKKCVVASFEGHRVVVAELAAAPKPMAAAPASPTSANPVPTNAAPTMSAPPPPQPAVAAKPIETATPVEPAKPVEVAKPVAASPPVEDDPLAEFDVAPPGAPIYNPIAGSSPVPPKPAASTTAPASLPARSKIPSGALVPAPAEYYEPVGDGTPVVISLAAEELLRRVRIACMVAAGGILLPMFVGFVLYSTTTMTSQNSQWLNLVYMLLPIIPTLTGVIAKFLCFGKQAEITDERSLKTSLILDGSGFAIALLAYLVEDDVFVVPLLVVCVACASASPFYFIKYLRRIAEGIGERVLIESSQRSELAMYYGSWGMTITAAIVALAYFSMNQLRGKTIILVLVELLIALVAFVLYAAMLAAFATNKKLASAVGSADVDATGAPQANGAGQPIGSSQPAGLSQPTGVLQPTSSTGSTDVVSEAVRRLRLTTGITAGTWGLWILIVVFAAVTGSTSPLVGLLAAAVLTVAKVPCLHKTEPLAHSSLAVTAFAIDCVGLLCAVCQLIALNSKLGASALALSFAAGLCSLISTLVFIRFLLKPAEMLRMTNVAMFLKVSQALFYVFLGLIVLTVLSLFAFGPRGLVVGLIATGLTLLLALLSNLIATVEMAINAKSPFATNSSR